MITDLSTYKNKEYHPGSKAKILTWYLVNRLFINTYLPFPQAVKRNILTIFGARIGRGVVFKPKVNIKYPWFLSIGDYTWIGEHVWIDNLAQVSIGDNVCLSQGAMLLCGNHNYSKTTFDLILGEIKLEDGVWIGAKAVVCPGLVCESHSVLSVNAVATKNLESFGVYQGNPAVKIRTRSIQ